MITVIFQTHDDEMALAHALAGLVEAATDGLVRDVIVVDSGSTDGTLKVADAAGCVVVPEHGGGGLAQATEMARGEWLLFLAPEAALSAEWASEARSAIESAHARGDGRARNLIFRVGRRRGGLRGWLRAARNPSGGTLVAVESFRRRVAADQPHGRPGVAGRAGAMLAGLLRLPPRLIGRV